MVSFMKNWAESIIFAIICIVMIEMILPEGSHKKYIKVVLGVYLLLVMINPILSQITKSTDFTDMLDLSQLYEEKTWEVSSLNTDSDLEFVAKEALRVEISRILSELNYMALTIDIKLNVEDKSNAKIESLKLELEKIKTQETIESINKVEINISENTKEKENLTEKEIEKIKSTLSKELEIKEENIQLK